MPARTVAVRARGRIALAARRALAAPPPVTILWLSPSGLPERLDAARSALAGARDDFDRLRIRDAAVVHKLPDAEYEAASRIQAGTTVIVKSPVTASFTPSSAVTVTV